MSAAALKLIAIAAMLCDHITAVFFPQLLPLRAIGRLTMPIMAYFAAVGFRKTRSIYIYMLRLFVFAIISEIPYYLVFETHSNVGFTLLFGVGALYIGELLKKKLHTDKAVLIPYAVMPLLAVTINSDWSYTGVLLIIAFYLAGGDKKKILIYPLPVYALYMLSFAVKSLSIGFSYFQLNLVQLAGLFSIPLLLLYNGKKGLNIKYFFYVFYPLHLLILWLIASA